MINKFKHILLVVAIATSSLLHAGNTDRISEAGAYELTINTQPRTMGLMGINSANVRGIDALGSNIAGLAHNRGLSVFSNYTNWLTVTGTNIVNLGVGSEISNGNNIGFNISYMNFGDLPLTTTVTPEPVGTFSPYYLNIGLSYARVFGKGVRAGITGKLINEAISGVSALGFSMDAGMQYTTGDKDDVHFGVFVRNLGFPMKMQGDGLIQTVKTTGTPSYDVMYFNRPAKFELPTLFSIGLTKDMYFGKKFTNDAMCKSANRLSVSGNFVYNSYMPNTYGLGLEYAFKEQVSLRAGYLYENGGLDKETTTRAHMGVSAGISYDMKLGNKDKKNPSVLEISYNFRPSWVFGGTHNIGFAFYTSKYSYCDEYVPTLKAVQIVEVAKESKPVEVKKVEPEKIYIHDTVFKDAPAKVETVVEYKQVNDMLSKFAGNIEFKSGTAILTERGEGTLSIIGDLMRQYPQARFNIQGHTDNDGTPENNMRLSKLRARTVARYLNEFKQIPENSLTVEWHGEEKPIADNTTDAGRQRNRRVEIKVLDNNSTGSTISTPAPTQAKVATQAVAPKSTVVETTAPVESLEIAKTPQEEMNDIAATISFTKGSDSLKSYTRKKVMPKLAAVLKSNPNLKIRIESHTDNGVYSMSLKDLSTKRAQSIVDALKAEGIDESRMTSEGMADTKSIDTNDSEMGRTRNQRIEIKVVN